MTLADAAAPPAARAPALDGLQVARAAVGSVSRPSVIAWMTRSCDADARRHLDQRAEVLDARVHAAVGDEADEVHARRAAHRGEQHLVAAEVRLLAPPRR